MKYLWLLILLACGGPDEMAREKLTNGAFAANITDWVSTGVNTNTGFASGGTKAWVWDATSFCAANGAAKVNYPDGGEYTSEIFKQAVTLKAGTYKLHILTCSPDESSTIEVRAWDGLGNSQQLHQQALATSENILIDVTLNQDYAFIGVQIDRTTAGNSFADWINLIEFYTFITPSGPASFSFEPIGAGELNYLFTESVPQDEINYRLEIEFVGALSTPYPDVNIPIAEYRQDIEGVVTVDVSTWLRSVLRMSESIYERFNTVYIKYQAKWDGGQDAQATYGFVHFYCGYNNWKNRRTQFEIKSTGGPFLV